MDNKQEQTKRNELSPTSNDNSAAGGDGQAGSTQAAITPSDQERPRPLGDRNELFHIVGIGASAGGLESLEHFFTALPTDTGMAFVVIQHLSPDFKSLMDELLARYTDLPIRRAEEGMRVEPNSIYLIPAKKEMIISDGRLRLTDKDPSQALSMPIDHFFRSLAQDVGPRSIAVVLSGSGSDGSRGVRDVHDAGGLVLAESDETAKFDGMPLAAQETGVVDLISAPQEMPAALVRHAEKVALTMPFSPSEATPELEGVQAIFKLLNDAHGIDFSHYKPNTVGRRIQRRLAFAHVQSFEDYVERLRNDEEELNLLYHDLLIGVTRFFRDRAAFETLENTILPQIVEKAGEDEIRVWVAGCATGEEAYSLAILLHEQLEAARRPINVKIFATDVHRTSLDIASAGIYSSEALEEVPAHRLERYFEKNRNEYHVVDELRQMVVFATQNVLKDAPFTKLDLITCRNMLIYFRPQAQKKAISLFHFGLKPSGILFLGPSETPSEYSDEFDTLDPHWKIYRKQRDVRLTPDLPLPLGKAPKIHSNTNFAVSMRSKPVHQAGLTSAYDAMLDRYMPAGLLVNERRELLHTFGGAERYLRLRGGRPSDDVLELFDRDLRTAVTGAIQRALKDNQDIHYAGLRIKSGDEEQRLDITIEPLANPRSKLKQLFIRIEPSAPRNQPAESQADADQSFKDRQISRDRIDSLESELRYNQENLQATIEELETSNEEMQATNEELVASNEELQSTNEELQSVNEELYTVNAEYQKKIFELSEMTADMNNLLESTEVGAIFLDGDLCIRKFTPQMGKEFHLLPHDIGRPIDSFTHSILHDTLSDDLQRVLATQQRVEQDVQDRSGRWHLLRILPYRIKGQVDGVVLTLIDVSSLKQAEAALSEAVERRDQFLAMLSHELRNPLGAILNATQLIEHLEIDNDTLNEVYEVIRRQSRQMARLLDDLLDVSRITQNKMELRRKAVKVADIVAAAVETARPLVDEAHQTLDIDVDGEDIWLDGDPDRLQQATSNLLTNASKYTPEKGRIELTVRRADNEVVIAVRDNGVGIPTEKLNEIFELFVQSDLTLDRSQGGMGVGLTLVRSIVELHGGTISVKSAGEQQGSEFSIRLPTLSATGYATVAEDSQRPSAAPALNGRVVVVEDQGDNRNLLKALLEMQGFEVFTAENGPQGLAAIEQHQPDLALIDIGLPGITGYDVAREVRRTLRNTRTHLVALTGYGQPADVDKAFASGFDDHLVKPLDTHKLSYILNVHRARKGQPHG